MACGDVQGQLGPVVDAYPEAPRPSFWMPPSAPSHGLKNGAVSESSCPSTSLDFRAALAALDLKAVEAVWQRLRLTLGGWVRAPTAAFLITPPVPCRSSCFSWLGGARGPSAPSALWAGRSACCLRHEGAVCVSGGRGAPVVAPSVCLPLGRAGAPVVGAAVFGCWPLPGRLWLLACAHNVIATRKKKGARWLSVFSFCLIF